MVGYIAHAREGRRSRGEGGRMTQCTSDAREQRLPVELRRGSRGGLGWGKQPHECREADSIGMWLGSRHVCTVFRRRVEHTPGNGGALVGKHLVRYALLHVVGFA